MNRIISIVFVTIFTGLMFVFGSSKSFAVVNPQIWQTTNGLSVTQDEGLAEVPVPTPPHLDTATGRRTAGLSIIVQDKGIPFLQLAGGVFEGVTYEASWVGKPLFAPAYIQLGNISISGASISGMSEEETNWANNVLHYTTSGGGDLKVRVSRLSPAILIDASGTGSNTMEFLSGNVQSYIYFDTAGNPQVHAGFKRNPNGSDMKDANNQSIRDIIQSKPKYIAYPDASGQVQVRTLDPTTATPIPTLSKPWMLVWYGKNSYFAETKRPTSWSKSYFVNWEVVSISKTEGYQADAPVLFVFEQTPSSIKQSANGGIEATFGTSAGNIAVMPILGRVHPKASDTDSWTASSIQTLLKTKADWWTDRLASFPTSVSETYGAYNATTDTSTVTESVTFQTIRSGGTKFAMIPPVLALAKDVMNITFSVTVKDANYVTEFGPVMGIESTTAGTSVNYNWSVSGLKKYTENTRTFSSGQPSADIEQKFNKEIDDILQSNPRHFAPWGMGRKEPYFLNPGDVLFHLMELYDAISVGTRQTDFKGYIQSERTSYPPETTAELPLATGTVRGSYGGTTTDSELNTYAPWGRQRFIPLYNLYSLSRYYETFPQDTLFTSIMTPAESILNINMNHQDWATMFWFQGNKINPQWPTQNRKSGHIYAGFKDKLIDVQNANRHLAGMIGFVKLAKKKGDSVNESVGRALLAKAAAVRIAFAKLPAYQYSIPAQGIERFVDIPANPDWHMTGYQRVGHFYNPSWASASDDHRQVVQMDQFGVYLKDTSFFPYDHWVVRDTKLIAYRDIVPETARLLSDYAPTESLVYLTKAEQAFPDWYLAFSKMDIGTEQNLKSPVDSYQLFLAKTFLQRGQWTTNPDGLAHYVDTSWIEAGDFFYMHKLAEAIKTYRGWAWADEGTVTPPPTTPSPTSVPGDTNYDGRVNLTDLSTVLSNFGSTVVANTNGDVNGDGTVNLSDLSALLSNFGFGG